MLRQMMYSSRARSETYETDLPEILRCSRRNNPEMGITGVLILVGEAPNITYIQAIEGEREHLDLLVDTISGDPRHTGLKILLDQEVEARAFAAWSMGGMVVPPSVADAGRIEAEVRDALCRFSGPSACTLISQIAKVAA